MWKEYKPLKKVSSKKIKTLTQYEIFISLEMFNKINKNRTFRKEKTEEAPSRWPVLGQSNQAMP